VVDFDVLEILCIYYCNVTSIDDAMLLNSFKSEIQKLSLCYCVLVENGVVLVLFLLLTL
jgi:hypothetical protein